MKGIVLLGSTGSIGRQTLDVVRAFPGEFKVVGLSGWRNRELLLQQAHEFKPQLILCSDGPSGDDLPPGCRWAESLVALVTHPAVELVVQAMVGNAGLLPTLKALEAGKAVALANKEPVVMAGELLMATARRHGAAVLPVDSEPSAIWQCLRGEDGAKTIRRVIITASGGPLRHWPPERLAEVTPEDALKHPTWHMGAKITIDSATLVNKAFEAIEAHWLFDVPWECIDVVVHPQSTIHSMVEFADGSVKAQLGPSDMRLPIQHALFYPRRPANDSLPRFDPVRVGALTFEAPDFTRYPCFPLALAVARRSGTYPAVLTAADEVAVQLFLDRRIRFTDIGRLIARAVELHSPMGQPSVDDLLAADAWARQTVLREAGVAP